jgi:hypothetical protein
MSKTTEQLRRDIDRGKAGDKIPFPDPAAAPLGTDEEAAGTPVPPDAIEQAHRDEVTRPDHGPGNRKGSGES